MESAMEELTRTPRTTVKRLPKRAAYDRATVNAILDASIICHVAFVASGTPMAIPTLCVRVDDRLYIHGSAASRMLNTVGGDTEISLTATLVDSVVLARSAFHHSLGYRSAVVIGRAVEVEDPEEKLAAMRALVEHIVPERWARIRPPSAQEMLATSVLRIPITEASAKIRTGGPIDDEEDYEMQVWAGVIPLRLEAKTPVADPRLAPGTPLPLHVADYRTPDARAGDHANDGAAREHRVHGVTISTDRALLDLDTIHGFLAGSYWAAGVSRETVARSISNSLCFGAYEDGRQVGFARVISDYATYAYLADVYVAQSYRGRGVSKALMAAVVAHPSLQGLRRFMLGTRDAHDLYRRFGFRSVRDPETWMEIADPDIYRRAASAK
jgi:nitroimidazol reductase NimA-like FMN-containing flavoprotein (pyridoxamine 5'-phosphate oxidase superfamily)/GNAT superfamily N-acetyltransferase